MNDVPQMIFIRRYSERPRRLSSPILTISDVALRPQYTEEMNTARMHSSLLHYMYLLTLFGIPNAVGSGNKLLVRFPARGMDKLSDAKPSSS